MMLQQNSCTGEVPVKFAMKRLPRVRVELTEEKWKQMYDASYSDCYSRIDAAWKARYTPFAAHASTTTLLPSTSQGSGGDQETQLVESSSPISRRAERSANEASVGAATTANIPADVVSACALELAPIAPARAPFCESMAEVVTPARQSQMREASFFSCVSTPAGAPRADHCGGPQQLLTPFSAKKGSALGDVTNSSSHHHAARRSSVKKENTPASIAHRRGTASQGMLRQSTTEDTSPSPRFLF